MATTINCNEIHQVALELQMKFQNCSVLDANDLDCLVELVTAIGDCITAGNYNQNNIVERVEVTSPSDSDSISTIVNNLPIFTINEDRIFIFSRTTQKGDNFLYIFKPGKGVYGTGSTTTLTDNDFILLKEPQAVIVDKFLVDVNYNNSNQRLFFEMSDGTTFDTDISQIVQDMPDGLNVNGTDLELLSGTTVLDTVDLCPIVEQCIANNPQIIIDIINNNTTVICDIVEDCGGTTDPLVPVQIEIDLGSCQSPADFVNPGVVNVYIEKPQSQVNSGFITILNGDILYTDSGLTSPFNGNNNSYMYRGIPPNQTNNQSFIVSTTGVISSYQASCNFQISDTFDYNGANNDQGSLIPNGTFYPLDSSVLTAMYTGTNPIQAIRTLIMPTIGDIGLQDDLQTVGEDMNITQITGNGGFYCRGLIDGSGSANENNGSFSTVWTYGIIDNTGALIDTVEFTFNANDTSL